VEMTRIGGKIALIKTRKRRKRVKLGQGPKVAFSGKINLFNFGLMNSFKGNTATLMTVPYPK
jgi:hypothetical protein